jgi:hypothetical protein
MFRVAVQTFLSIWDPKPLSPVPCSAPCELAHYGSTAGRLRFEQAAKCGLSKVIDPR